MILRALYQLSKDEHLVDALDYFWRNVAWIIELRPTGKLKRVTDNRRNVNEGKTDKKGNALPAKMVGKPMYCTNQFYRSGRLAAPHFLVDTARYVFGVDDSIKADRALALNALFRQKIARCAADTDCAAVHAVVKFLESNAGKATAIPEDADGGDMYAFQVNGTLVHLEPAVMTWWRLEEARKDEGDGDYQCLVTGEKFRQINLFPKTGGIPGASQDIKVVSCREGAYASHGWVENENAPICREAGTYIGAALNRLMATEPMNARGELLPSRSIRIPGDVALCYWAHNPSDLETRLLNDFWNIVMGNPTRRDGSVLDSEVQGVWEGKPIDIDDPAIVYVLGISGGMGRATIRAWHETTVPEMFKGLSQHFADMTIGRTAMTEKEPVIPLHRVIASLTTCEGSNPVVSVNQEMAIIQAALSGKGYPSSIPQLVVQRVRAEIGKSGKDDNEGWIRRARMDARMALLKAYLNRRRRTDFGVQHRYPEIKPHMDPTIAHPGYCLGAMLALMERIQQAAAGKKLNSTIIDRFFGAASTSPQSAFTNLLRMSQHHIAKAKRGEKLDRLMAIRCERMLTALHTKFDAHEGIPTRLNIEGQSMFMLGYHQMSHWLYMPKEVRAAWEARYLADADPAFLWQQRAKEFEREAEEIEAAPMGAL